MGVSTFTQPDFTTQSGAAYKGAIDAAAAVMARLAAAFAPHQQTTADMTVRVDAGVIPTVAGIPTEVAAQSTGTLTAPSGNPRNDIVHIDAGTGTVGVATGSEAASPSDPAVPAGKIAVARIALTVGMTEITNSDLTDLRYLTLPGVASALAATGLTESNGQLAVDIAGLTSNADPGASAELMVLMGGNLRRATFQNMLKGVGDLTELTSVVTDTDIIPILDGGPAGTPKYVKPDNIGLASDFVALETVNLSGGSTADLTAFDNATYSSYLVLIENLSFAGGTSDGVGLRTSTDGGSTFDSGGSNYQWSVIESIGAAVPSAVGSTGDTVLRLTSGVSNQTKVGTTAGTGLRAVVEISRPGEAVYTAIGVPWLTFTDNNGTPHVGSGAGERLSAADVDAVQILALNGNNFTGGRAILIGIKAA